MHLVCECPAVQYVWICTGICSHSQLVRCRERDREGERERERERERDLEGEMLQVFQPPRAD
jgi:hypothetical protein